MSHIQIGNQCPLITTNRHDYIQHPVVCRKNLKPQQTDRALIAGYVGSNLQVGQKRLRTKTWPEITLDYEEYKDFLERLKCCKQLIYNMYYKCADVNLQYLEDLLKGLMKTVYQCGYSPSEYWPLNDERRFAKLSLGPTNMKYYETMYRIYYNRIAEVEKFRDALRGKLYKRDEQKQELKKEIRNCCRLGTTNYYMTICLPAIINMEKPENRTEPRPIDQYTLRRV